LVAHRGEELAEGLVAYGEPLRAGDCVLGLDVGNAAGSQPYFPEVPGLTVAMLPAGRIFRLR
jgi:hypothetical protein